MNLYNSEIISTLAMVRVTIDILKHVIEKPLEFHHLMIHTDQGYHYQHSGRVYLLNESNINMSRRGIFLENSLIEHFFRLLKQGMYYEWLSNYE